MGRTDLSLEEEDRQMVLLAIAILALQRPGWDTTLGRIADMLNGRKMFESFKRLNQRDETRGE